MFSPTGKENSLRDSHLKVEKRRFLDDLQHAPAALRGVRRILRADALCRRPLEYGLVCLCKGVSGLRQLVRRRSLGFSGRGVGGRSQNMSDILELFLK